MTPLCVKFPDDDLLELLARLSDFERLPRAEILRRALRSYAVDLGVARPRRAAPRRDQRVRVHGRRDTANAG